MHPVNASAFTPEELASWVDDARERTLALVADLGDEELRVPYRPIVNPFLWEIGHVAWFQERWVLRHAAGREPLSARADALFDSSAVAHTTRWELDLPSREETIGYLHATRDAVLERLGGELRDDDVYFVLLALFHEDMHDEAFTYMRQTMGYPPPSFVTAAAAEPARRRLTAAPDGGARGDVEVPGGTWMLGASRGDPFVFDNEKWAHAVELEPYAISRAAVTQGEFAAFVEDGGYRRRELWSDAGWTWREAEGAERPLYWRREGSGWLRRRFDAWAPLESDLPAVHVNWHEAEAWCRWAGRRLPTETEWEAAAAGEPAGGGLAPVKRRVPWGNTAGDDRRANLDWRAGDCAPVGDFAAGDSALGCRQMLGNVWEWTASDFLPFPGFEPDPYRDYSQPWFGTRKVLRGGAWATRSRLASTGYRNFFTPDRRDVIAGFRTCAPRRT